MSASKITFVGTDAGGMPLKRKQSQRACEQCRKRKKRCLHHPPEEQIESSASDTASIPSPQARSNVQQQHSPLQQRPKNVFHRLTHPSMSPSTVTPSRQQLVLDSRHSTTSAAIGNNVTITNEDEEDRDLQFVGELNPEGIFVADTSPAGTTTAPAATPSDEVVGTWVPRKPTNAAKALPGRITSLLLPYLEDECSRAMPAPAEYEVLYKIYLDEVHPILPIIDLESYHSRPARSKTLLKLAICLCVASNANAAAQLKLTPKDFTVQVTQLLRSAVDNEMVRDNQVVMQLLAVLALVTQLSDDRHASAEFTCRTVARAQTSGLHLDTSARRGDDSCITRLFCVVFAIDRLNAAVQGRPVMMHERDFGRNLTECIGRQDGLFQLLLRVILLLDRVIALYRPSQSVTGNGNGDGRGQALDVEFPAFEDLLGTCGTVRASAALVATVETLYHAVAMLSCRSQSLNELSRNSSSHTRQKLSAASITNIVGNEYRGQLSILPFVPYAMSLALRVFYRDLRLSKSSFTRTRARRQLLHVCTLLRELGDVFSSSIQMAELAEQTVREMDRAYSNVVGQKRGSVAPGWSEAGPYDAQHVHMTNADQRQADSSAINSAASQQQATSASDPMALPNDYDMQAFETAHYDFDLDIFDHFDPNFDIEAMDAALANDIDPALPTAVTRWDA